MSEMVDSGLFNSLAICVVDLVPPRNMPTTKNRSSKESSLLFLGSSGAKVGKSRLVMSNLAAADRGGPMFGDE